MRVNRRANDFAAVSEQARLQGLVEQERQARRRAETLAETRLQDVYAKQKQIELLNTIASTANQSDSIAHVLRSALAAIGQYLDWPVGHAYLTRHDENSDYRELNPTGIWHLAATEPFTEFRENTDNTPFASGHGLPGRVLTNGEPAWIENLAADDNFPRAPQVLTDMFGSTPSNVAIRVARGANARVIAGANLPMLIRVLNYQHLPLTELVNKALSGGHDGILLCDQECSDAAARSPHR